MRNFYIIFGTFFINGIVSLIAMRFLTKHLQGGDYGMYGLIVSSASIVNAIYFQWIRVYILRVDFSKGIKLHEIKWLRGVVYKVLIVLAITAVSLIAIQEFLAYFHIIKKVSYEKIIFLVAFLGGCQGIYEVKLAEARAMDQMKKFGIFNVGKSIFWLFGIFAISYIYSGYGAIILVLSGSYIYLAALDFFKNRRSLGVNLQSESENDERINLNMFTPILGVVFSLALPFLFKFMASKYLSGGVFDTISADYDLSSLICSTLPVAFNYLYQTKLVKYYNETTKEALICFNRSCHIAIGAVLFSGLLSFIVFKFFKNDIVVINEVNINPNTYLFIISSALLTSIKANWLDHSFYLRRSYIQMAIGSFLNLAAVPFIFTLLNLICKNAAPDLYLAVSLLFGVIVNIFYYYIINYKIIMHKMQGLKVLFAILILLSTLIFCYV